MRAARRGRYEPDRGDLVFLNFTPQAGHEQSGHRPALILSPRTFNTATGLAFACPITNRVRGSAFEVPVPENSGLTGVVLAQQLRAIDWFARGAAFHGKAGDATVGEVLARIEPVLGFGR